MNAAMNQRLARTTLLALLLALPSLAQVKDYREIKTPPLRSFSMPQPKRIALPNGMILFLQEDHELPLIRGTAIIRGGERDVPADKAGLAGIYGSAWRTGGTESKSGDQLDEFLEARAARVETSADTDSASVRLDVLKNDFDTVLPIFVELLQKPGFRQDKIDLAKTQARTAISRRNDEPGNIVIREAAKLGYGADSPYTRQPEYDTIASITRDDLLAFHRRFVHPNNILLGLVGDFDSAKMEKKLRDTFASWKRGPQAPAPAMSGTPAVPGVYFIAKEDVNQSNVAMVHPGAPLRSDPDYHAVVVMNEILSGGFSGRLMNELRSRLGLTYGVGGGILAQWDHPGLVRVQMATKSESTLQSVEALRGELRKLHTEPFTAEELALAKESILNAFVFTMDSRAKVLNQRMLLEFYGYPADFWQKYKEGIERVTAEDVARVAKKYVHPDRLAILVVGNEKQFEKPLATLGAVTPIDITIPEPGASKKESAAPAAPPSAQSAADGKALVLKVQQFVGGRDSIAAVRATRQTMSMKMKTPAGEMEMESEATVRYPDARKQVVKTPMGEMTTVITPDAAFMTGPMGLQDLPASQRDAARNESKIDFMTILSDVDKGSYAVVGSEKIGSVDAQIVEITREGAKVKWWIDPATGAVLRGARQTGRGEQVLDFAEWKAFGGVRFPIAITMSVGGEKVGEMKVQSVEVNPPLDEKTFAKP